MIDLFPVIIEIMLANIFKVLLFLSFFIFDVMFLGIPSEQAAIAIGGALAGAMVLGYIKRHKGNDWIERIIKVICSATSALFIAPVIVEYYQLKTNAYIGFIFFVVSMLSLFILRALINMTEQNAASAIKPVFVRVFNIQVKETKKHKDIHLTKGDN